MEFFLAAAGIIIIIASFIVSEKKDREKGRTIEVDREAVELIMEENRKEFQDKMEKILSERAEEIVIKTDDQLSQVSNEKIMALSEYSDQVLEKMEQNHSEVIFLYNTLSEKEKEMKELVKQIDRTKVITEDIILSQNAKAADRKIVAEQSMASSVKTVSSPKQKRVPDTEEIERNPERQAKGNSSKPLEIIGQNQNEKILKMHREGKSIMEISKILGQGQGEVKLVIDLFRGRT